MAKKHKTKLAKTLQKLAQAKAKQNTTALLHEAVRMLRLGNTNLTLRLATEAMNIASNSAEKEAAAEIFVEAHFRIAVSGSGDDRLQHLAEAIRVSPQDPRLKFCSAITLLQMSRFSEALTELDAVADQQPEKPGLAYLHQLARLLAGQDLDTSRPSPAEVEILCAIESLLKGAAIAPTASADRNSNYLPALQMLSEMLKDPVSAPVLPLKEAAEKIGKKDIVRILDYYRGVAAMRAGDRESARSAWLKAQSAGYKESWLSANLSRLEYDRILEPLKQSRWQEVINLIDRLPAKVKDPFLDETAGLAHYHLGYQAALSGSWETAARNWRKAGKLIKSFRLSHNLALAEEALENWGAAAAAWREMVRARSRKAGNPNYLNNSQVAAIWERTAECYYKDDEPDEAVTCLKTALKYAEKDMELRLDLVDLLLDNQQEKAARNELMRILSFDPQNVEALMQLGNLTFADLEIEESIKIFKKVLTIDPQRADAREALADSYIRAVDLKGFWPKKRLFDLLESGLVELPENPKLLISLSKLHRKAGDDEEAGRILLRAYRAAPQNVYIASDVIHEALHLKGGDSIVKEVLPEIHLLPHLLPGFWIDQGKMALGCNLGIEWVRQFFDEAVSLSESRKERGETKALILLDIFMSFNPVEEHFVTISAEMRELQKHYVKRAESEVPQSGTLDYINAFRSFSERQDRKEALRLLREGKRKARVCGETGVLEAIEVAEGLLTRGPKSLLLDPDMSEIPIEVLERLIDKFPKGPPSRKRLEEALYEIFEETDF
jgi:tetratricopeptide (TPR) repeat protein